MDHVYVVTYGWKGSEDGQFHKEEAYVRLEDAESAARDRMNILGGLMNDFTLFATSDTKNSAHPHVVKRWDSKGNYGYTVWLERLEVQE